ncbi:putative membrane protein [Synechococcus sp. A15-44]|nr:putative membrane protein [Synechococcus sp. A15-44]
MYRFISLAGVVGGVAVTVAALGSSEKERLEKLAIGSGLFAGSAVAALLADAGVRRKFRPILDV